MLEMDQDTPRTGIREQTNDVGRAGFFCLRVKARMARRMQSVMEEKNQKP